jgi:hypothetical protein
MIIIFNFKYMERITIETSSQILNELYKKAAICEKSCRFIDPE